MQLLQNLWLSGERYISRSNWQAKPYQIFMVQNALPPQKKMADLLSAEHLKHA